MIRKVITDVYEDVHFSDKYDHEQIGLLVRELDVRHSHFINLPIVSDVRDFLNGELLISSIYSTSAIGKPDIEEEDVRNFLAGKEHNLDTTKSRIVNNIRRTFEFVSKHSNTFEMTPENIRRLHVMYTMDTSEGLPGVFRTKDRAEVNNDYKPPRGSLDELTKEFCDWYSSRDMKQHHPAVRAFLAHYHIGMLQPFF